MLITIFNKLKIKEKASFIDNIFSTIESFCGQGSNGDVESLYLKIVSILSQMVAIVITASFGAVITSFLTVEILQIPFTDIKEFADNGEYKLILYRGNFLDKYFQMVIIIKYWP